MAKKHRKLLEDPPSASSSEEEGEGEEEESDSSYEEDELMDPVKFPSGMEMKSTSPANQSSDSDSDSDPDSETELALNPGSGKASAVTVSKPKKKESEPSAKKKLKRQSEGTSTDVNAKRVKKNVSGEETKKAYFQRVWSEEDEITLLQGIIDSNADTGNSPFEEKKVLYETLKESISFEVSFCQFTEKITSLKKKYMASKKKKKSFSNAHDQKLFELSNYIWGSNGLALKSAVKSMKSNAKKVEKDRKADGLALKSSVESLKSNSKKVEDDSESHESDWFEESSVVGAIVGLGAGKADVKQRWSMVPMETKKILEEKWKVLQVKEIEFVLQKTHFLSEVTSLIYR